MSEKFFDFDAAMEEKKSKEKPFVVKAFGEKHEIPNDVPFDVILSIQRAYKDGKQTMSEDDVVGLCKVIFGESAFEKWLQKGITLSGIMLLMENVMAMYMGKADNTARKTAEKKQEGIDNP